MENETDELMELLQTAMKERGAKAIAGHVQKAYSTLMSEVNSTNKDHKLGITTFLEILNLIDNEEVLQWFGKQYGYLLIPMPSIRAPSESIERLMIEAGKDFGEISKTFLDVTDTESEGGREITPNEWKLLDKALLKAIQSYYRIRSFSEQMAQEIGD